MYTAEQKLAMYRAGQYVFRAPPVPSSRWSEQDWINFIDAGKWWRPVKETV